MKKAIYVEMTNTYRVENNDGTFSAYSPDQYIKKFGALPEAVEDVTDTVEEVGLVGESETISDVEETVTSVDGTVTVPTSEIEAGVKAFDELSEEDKKNALKEAAEEMDTPNTPVEEANNNQE